MGRLRDRRRGGGPARTISGLNRAGTATKVIGNVGGTQFPIVGEHDGGRVVTLTLNGTTPITEDLGRFSGVYLADIDPYSGGDIPVSLATTVYVNFTTRGNNLVAWCNSGTPSVSFWVY